MFELTAPSPEHQTLSLVMYFSYFGILMWITRDKSNSKRLKRWRVQSKKSLRHFIRTKDVDHLKDVARLTKYYIQK